MRKNLKLYQTAQNISDEALIGDNCTIHSHVWIGSGVTMGHNCKIQAFAFIPDGVVLGENVFIGPHVCFTNDKHPKAHGAWKQSKTVVKNGASIGANATVVCGITIGKNATVGAGSVVTRDVPDGATVVGNPARILHKEVQHEVGC